MPDRTAACFVGDDYSELANKRFPGGRAHRTGDALTLTIMCMVKMLLFYLYFCLCSILLSSIYGSRLWFLWYLFIVRSVSVLNVQNTFPRIGYGIF